MDANEWLRKYNELRPHSGKYCYGKTPMQTFLDAKALVKEKQLDKIYQENDNNKNKETNSIATPAEVNEAAIFLRRETTKEIQSKFSLSDRQSVG